ncbi:MAG TPA: hypothetical protein VFP78_07350, partial [Solirubrobacteraceae bacterium]|nr:hypothetical protein [Solirubrobacteraceae bacterium]
FTLVFAGSVVAVLFARNIGGGISLGPWVAASVCLAAYGGLALASFRGMPLGDRLSWWAAVAAAHTALGLLAAWLFGFIRSIGLDAALAQAFGGFAPVSLVSLVAAPLAALPFRPRLPVHRIPRAARGSGAGAPGLDPRPVSSPPPSRWATSPPPAPPVSRAAAPLPPVSAPEPSAGRELRVSFARIAEQLPPDMLALPADRLSTMLREPGRVVVPLDLVVPQLADGAAAVPATVLDDQLPRGAVLASLPEARARWEALRLALPMDEVLAQVPSAGALVDVSVGDVDRSERLHATEAVEPAEVVHASATVEASEAVGTSEAVDGTVAPDAVGASARAAVDPVPPAPVPPIEAVPATLDAVPASTPRRRLGANDIDAVVACLAPAGPFDVQARDVDGLWPLLSLTRGVAPEAVADAVCRLVTALPPPAGAPAVVTLVCERATLAMVAGEDAALVAAAGHPGAATALLEQLVGRAAAALALAPLRRPAEGGDALVEVALPSTPDVDALGPALHAFGRVVPAVFRDATRDLDVYVFRPGSLASVPLGRLAAAVDAALAAGGLGRPLSLGVRDGGSRTELRWVRPSPARAAVLAAVGGVERPGLARRQLAQAAAALEVA